ncbi:pilus assembly protein PilW [Escherichia coli]|nr:pilus assembly protein PilW [Escherichia marmotae]EFN9757090.1 pilus assembly protein PilW [Escherichia coli]PSS40931.1 pilus assembly protein PilW [Escherichia sp. MOD1-EC5451]PSY66916.1 pilus assembly protein PilW [Escherichia sp. 20412-1]PSZ15174.1 pilus assembly protein PilW [Escherichia sp. 4726-5]PTN25458.1 pilus assembly protein PilW [Escherichia sp. MOD1-EC6475]
MNVALSCNCLININGAFLLTLRQYVTMQQ